MESRANVRLEGSVLDQDFTEKLGIIKRWICDHSPMPNLYPSKIDIIKCDLIDSSRFYEEYYIEYDVVT